MDQRCDENGPVGPANLGAVNWMTITNEEATSGGPSLSQAHRLSVGTDYLARTTGRFQASVESGPGSHNISARGAGPPSLWCQVLRNPVSAGLGWVGVGIVSLYNLGGIAAVLAPPWPGGTGSAVADSRAARARRRRMAPRSRSITRSACSSPAFSQTREPTTTT